MLIEYDTPKSPRSGGALCEVLLIPFRLNNSAYDVFAISFTYSVGGDQTSE